MAVRPLVSFPDPRLRMPAAAVTVFDGGLRDLAQDLADTMRAAPGVGITAPHVGVLIRLVVIGLDPAGPPQVYVNPWVVEASGDRVRHMEGSISMPGITDEVERLSRVRIGFQDLDGTPRHEEAVDFMAACLQHEIDQLDGIFWLDRLSRLKRDRLIRRHDKLRRR